MHDRLKEAHILIVDDSAVNLQIALNTLNRDNYHLTAVTSGKKALERLAEKHYDLILLDIMMPEMDGWETCQRLKKMDG